MKMNDERERRRLKLVDEAFGFEGQHEWINILTALLGSERNERDALAASLNAPPTATAVEQVANHEIMSAVRR